MLSFARHLHSEILLRVGKKVEKVPWAKKVQSRPCEEFQSWLLRGNFQEGDDCDWAEAGRKEKLLEKWRRRGGLELKTSEQELARAQPGAAGPTLDLSAPDCSYCSEEEEGWRSPERGEREELGGMESDSSSQSIKTHIRTPPRISTLEEVEQEEEGTFRTPERVEERLVKIPIFFALPDTRRLNLNLRSGEVGSPGGREGGGDQSVGGLSMSGLVRSGVTRLKLC